MSPNTSSRMMWMVCATALFAASVVSSAAIQELPGGAISCQIDTPLRDECIREAVQSMLPRLGNGIARLNIPPLDPWVRAPTTYEFKQGALQAHVQVKETTIYGVTDAQILDVRSHVTEDGIETEFDSFFPRVHMKGSYKGEGRIDGLKLNSKGDFNFTFTGVRTTTKVAGIFVKRDGHKFLEVNSFDVAISMEDFQFNATGLFPDPELNQIAVSFINQYWPFVYQQVLPGSRAVWEPLLIKETNQFLATLPFEKMLFYGEKKATKSL